MRGVGCGAGGGASWTGNGASGALVTGAGGPPVACPVAAESRAGVAADPGVAAPRGAPDCAGDAGAPDDAGAGAALDAVGSALELDAGAEATGGDDPLAVAGVVVFGADPAQPAAAPTRHAPTYAMRQAAIGTRVMGPSIFLPDVRGQEAAALSRPNERSVDQALCSSRSRRSRGLTEWSSWWP